ncbi:amino acid ABC transporter substrate-binding protein [Allorhizobium undicola]|uniref:amino acid ABC transporter substrate-binding protein n=1 Tax=Allorhizobium undicola TaxID=78527 RepID=UPI003D3421BA
MMAALTTRFLALVLVVLAVVSRVYAQEVADGQGHTVSLTIERLRQTHVLRVGYGTAAPFSFTNANGDISGYSIDLCREMAEEMRQILQLPEIRTEYVFRTPANRLQLLNEGGMDIECNASTNLPERRKAANFAPAHFFMRTRLVSLKRNNIHKLEDLRGKSVSVVLGTVNISQILQLSRERRLGLVTVPVDEVERAFELVNNGSVSAFAMDDILLHEMIARSGHPQDFSVSEEGLGEPAAYGFMTRINDPEFADLVAKALWRVYRSDRMQKIYDRWFMQPFGEPPHSLNLPMSAELRAMMESVE